MIVLVYSTDKLCRISNERFSNFRYRAVVSTYEKMQTNIYISRKQLYQ